MFQIPNLNMKSISTTIWVVVFILLPEVVASKAIYTNIPLNGYFCDGDFYENITDVSHPRCLHRCLSNSKCVTLSYNPVGHYCLLESERCPSATLHSEFMLMVFRESERQHDCISWVPKSEEATTHRLLKATVGYPYRLGRLNEGNNQTIGFAFDWIASTRPGILYVADLQVKRGKLVEEYDVLVASPSCTLAWVPYTAGDSLPDGAQQTGVLNGVAVYSIMKQRTGSQYFGFYVARGVKGYYTDRHGQLFKPKNMYLLIHI